MSDIERSYGVSHETSRKVFQLLSAEGLVVGIKGSGFKVAEAHPLRRLGWSRLSRTEREAGRGAFLSDAQAGGFEAGSAVVITREAPPADVAELLGSDTECVVRRRTMRADARVVQLATSWIPADIAELAGLDQVETGRGGAYSRIEDAGYRLDHFIERVTARPATPPETQQFGFTAPGRPVLVITRTREAASSNTRSPRTDEGGLRGPATGRGVATWSDPF